MDTPFLIDLPFVDRASFPLRHLSLPSPLLFNAALCLPLLPYSSTPPSFCPRRSWPGFSPFQALLFPSPPPLPSHTPSASSSHSLAYLHVAVFLLTPDLWIHIALPRLPRFLPPLYRPARKNARKDTAEHHNNHTPSPPTHLVSPSPSGNVHANSPSLPRSSPLTPPSRSRSLLRTSYCDGPNAIFHAPRRLPLLSSGSPSSIARHLLLHRLTTVHVFHNPVAILRHAHRLPHCSRSHPSTRLLPETPLFSLSSHERPACSTSSSQSPETCHSDSLVPAYHTPPPCYDLPLPFSRPIRHLPLSPPRFWPSLVPFSFLDLHAQIFAASTTIHGNAHLPTQRWHYASTITPQRHNSPCPTRLPYLVLLPSGPTTTDYYRESPFSAFTVHRRFPYTTSAPTQPPWKRQTQTSDAHTTAPHRSTLLKPAHRRCLGRADPPRRRRDATTDLLPRSRPCDRPIGIAPTLPHRQPAATLPDLPRPPRPRCASAPIAGPADRPSCLCSTIAPAPPLSSPTTLDGSTTYTHQPHRLQKPCPSSPRSHDKSSTTHARTKTTRDPHAQPTLQEQPLRNAHNNKTTTRQTQQKPVTTNTRNHNNTKNDTNNTDNHNNHRHNTDHTHPQRQQLNRQRRQQQNTTPTTTTPTTATKSATTTTAAATASSLCAVGCRSALTTTTIFFFCLLEMKNSTTTTTLEWRRKKHVVVSCLR